MSNKKFPNNLLSTLLFVSILSGALTSLPLNGLVSPFEQRMSRNRLKKEIDQRIKAVKRVINGLKAAKIIVPSAIVGAGIAATAAATVTAATVALLFLIPALKYHKALKRFTKDAKKVILALKRFTKDAKKVILDDDKKHEKIALMIDSLKTLLKQKDVHQLEMHAYQEFLKNAHPKEVIQEITKKLKKMRLKNTITRSVAAIASGVVTIALSGLAGATSFFLLKFLGLSKKTVATTLDNIKRLAKIEKNNPGILNAQQKSIIGQFKKLQKNPTVLGIIQNLQQKAALEKIVITSMEKHPLLVKLIGTEKADKLFATYIKLKWQERTLQQAIDAYIVMNASGLKVSSTKRELRKTKKKIVNLEARHPRLRTALKKAVQEYSLQADNILETLKKELMKTVEPKRVKIPEFRIVPL